VAAVALMAAGLPAPGAPRTSSRPEATRLTIAASGDFLIHTPVAAQALANGGGTRYDFAPMFRPVRRWIRGADLALCHVETTLVPGRPAGYPTPRGRRRFPILEAGGARVAFLAYTAVSNGQLVPNPCRSTGPARAASWRMRAPHAAAARTR
jgi:hypothetical protein